MLDKVTCECHYMYCHKKTKQKTNKQTKIFAPDIYEPLHTLIDKYLGHMLVKFEQNRFVLNIKNVGIFLKNC